MLRSLREHNVERLAHGSEELRVGIGINSGVVGLGLVGGVNRMVLSTVGDAVNLAARIEGTNKRYDSAILISDATYAQLADPAQFLIRRMERVMVVNRRQPVTLYEVYNEDPEVLRFAKISAQRRSTRPSPCSTTATWWPHGQPSSDAGSCCPTIPSPPCTSHTAMRSRGENCPQVKRSRCTKSTPID